MEMRVFLWKSVGSLSDERGQLPPAVQRCNCKAAPRRKGHACGSDKWPSRMFPLRRKADGRIESSSVPSIVLPNPDSPLGIVTKSQFVFNVGFRPLSSLRILFANVSSLSLGLRRSQRISKSRYAVPFGYEIHVMDKIQSA